MEKTNREFSSGGVVFKRFKTANAKNLVKWLVCASMPSKLFPKSVWRLPKGWIDDSKDDFPGPMGSGQVRADEQSLRRAALREVREEAGIEAKILIKLGTGKYFYDHPARGKILKFVTFYLMEWVGDLPEGFDEETSEVLWLPYIEAFNKLDFRTEKDFLKKAREEMREVV